MTAQELLDKFNERLQKNSWWARFTNNQFVKMMAIFGAQIIYYAQVYAERALSEGFISTATKRSSILAAAEDKGYVGRLITPSFGICNVQNKTEYRIQLPAYSTFLSDEQYPYVLVDALDIAPNETLNDVKTKQMELVVVSKKVQEEEEFLTVILPRDLTAECVSIDVYVSINDYKELWYQNTQFRLGTGNSKNYVMFYKPTEQLGIRFGDGSIGKMPPAGSEIEINVWCSQGDLTLVEGQRLTPSDSYAKYKNMLEVTTSSPVTGGAGSEETEETRSRAQYYVAYDEQVVWGGDYQFFIKSKVGGISWLNVWGEEEQEKSTGVSDLDNINTIFICAHKPKSSQESVKNEILEAFKSVPNELNKKFVYNETNEIPFTITLTGTADKSILISDAETKIREQLELSHGIDALDADKDELTGSRKDEKLTTVDINKIWATVESCEVLRQFEIEVEGKTKAKHLNDFIYLNVQASTINITY